MFLVLRIYWPSIRKHWLLFVVTLSAMVAAIYLKALSPYYIRDIVNIFTGTTPDIPRAQELFWILVVLFIAINVAYRLFDWWIVLYEARVMRDLDQRSFAALQNQSIRFFESTFSGSLVKCVTRFRNSFEGITDALFFEIGRDAVMLTVTLVILVHAMPSFAIAFAIWTIVFLGLSLMAAWWKYPLDAANAEVDSRVGGALADSISNHLTVKAFGCEKSEQTRFNGVVEHSYQARLRSWFASNIVIGGQGALTALAELGLIWWMIKGWERGVVTVGDFVFFQSYVIWIVGHLWSFGRNLQKLFRHVADAKEMAEIYCLTPEVRNAPSAHPLVVTEGHIDFHAVSFRYGEKTTNRDTLSSFSLRIPAGQSVGLVGKTGIGKSTVVKLLLRLYDVHSGYIRIDMQDIANVTQESLRQQIAVVPQHPQLFHRTLRENISFARPDATEQEIMAAAKKAYAWEFIKKQPNGLDTIVGERGVKLSGGQQQRIAIARAIVADQKILILDEATSSLDSETEKYIQKAIANLLEERTAIVIAHRLSTIMKLDRIIVIEDGTIVEDGAHDELLARRGQYASLWTHQSGGYIP